MNGDTEAFLTTLLWLATEDAKENGDRSFENKQVCDFTDEFIAGVESFVDGFRAYLEKTGFDMDSLARLERSFGGNVYFSLSGHGCGFFDDRDTDLAELHNILKAYSVRAYRFEELSGMLEVNEQGKIDISIKPEFIKEYRDKYFVVEGGS